jgi:hypothetical protein
MSIGYAWRLDRMRQQSQEGRSQQGAGRETNEVRQHPVAQRLMEDKEYRRRQYAQYPADQAEQNNPDYQRHSVIPCSIEVGHDT